MSERMSERDRAIRIARVQSRAARERTTFEREEREQADRDERLARMDSERSSRSRGGYGLRW